METIARKIVLLWGVKRAGISFLAGIIASLAMPPIDFYAAMFISFPILVWLLDGASSPKNGNIIAKLMPAFWVGWFFGFGYFFGGIWWIGRALLVDASQNLWALPIAAVGLPALLAVFYGAGLVFARAFWSDGAGRLAALAAGLSIAEIARSYLFTGFPWNLIGMGAMPVPLTMQSASVIGLIGVTGLAIFVFATPALIATKKGLSTALIISSFLVTIHLGFGFFTLSNAVLPTEKENSKEQTIFRLVQPSISQEEKWDSKIRDSIFKKLLALSSAPAKDNQRQPDIIIWPETSLPYILTENNQALTQIANTLNKGQLLIAGGVRVDNSNLNDPLYFNSIYVINDQGYIIKAVDKVRLVPFGEYLPFKEFFESIGLTAIAASDRGFNAANRKRSISLPNGRQFWPLICYEAIFPHKLQNNKNKPDYLINLTNDAWFGNTPGPYQHSRIAQIRAVEQQIPLIRVANNGISSVFDPYGRPIVVLPHNYTGFTDSPVQLEYVPLLNNNPLNLGIVIVIILILGSIITSRRSFIGGMN